MAPFCVIEFILISIWFNSGELNLAVFHSSQSLDLELMEKTHSFQVFDWKGVSLHACASHLLFQVIQLWLVCLSVL